MAHLKKSGTSGKLMRTSGGHLSLGCGGPTLCPEYDGSNFPTVIYGRLENSDNANFPDGDYVFTWDNPTIGYNPYWGAPPGLDGFSGLAIGCSYDSGVAYWGWSIGAGCGGLVRRATNDASSVVGVYQTPSCSTATLTISLTPP